MKKNLLIYNLQNIQTITKNIKFIVNNKNQNELNCIDKEISTQLIVIKTELTKLYHLLE